MQRVKRIVIFFHSVRTFSLSSLSLSSTLFHFPSCFLVYPFSSTRSRQATRHLQQSLQTHCLWNRRLVFAQRHGHCIVYSRPFNLGCKFWHFCWGILQKVNSGNLTTQDYNSSHFSGSTTFMKIKDFTNLNFWKSIYYY